MNYDHITDLATLTPDEYDEFVDWLKERTAEDLRPAKGSPDQIRAAINTYLARCAQFSITRGEFTDFFCVDTPNILDIAGYSEAEADDAVKLFESVPLNAK